MQAGHGIELFTEVGILPTVKCAVIEEDRQGGESMLCRNGEEVLNTADILIPGVHNIENYMAAIAMVEGLVSDDTVRHVAKTFGGVEHRIELVRIKDGIRFYNDSIASSPSRTIAGLRSFDEKVILIAGGYDKHIPYDVLGPEICQHVKKLFLGGATGPQIRAAVENCAEFTGQVEITDCADFDNIYCLSFIQDTATVRYVVGSHIGTSTKASLPGIVRESGVGMRETARRSLIISTSVA